MGFIRYGRFIDTLHLELSSRCNVACPGCLRTVNPQALESALNDNLSLEAFKALFSQKEISSLVHVYACGNLGDPVMAPDCKAILSYIRTHNPYCHLAIHTNGALRNEYWWCELPAVLGENHLVTFGIDGLSDTNHLYRKGAVWEKIIKNVKAFISSGGHAEWVFIVFEHNQHQIEEARLLAKELGFKKFQVRYSHRANRGGLTYVRGPSYQKQLGKVRCAALEKQELYVDATGKLYPCCFLADLRFQEPREKWEVDIEDEDVVNWVPFSPRLSKCQRTCTQVTIKDEVIKSLE